MGAEPPFLYGPPSRYSALEPEKEFNPKIVTQASMMPPPKPLPKKEGPLVNFNRHPDSYVILPYGQTNAKMMSPKTKKRVTRARWVQLGLRIAQLVVAIGLLVCVICVRGTKASEGWIIRIPPALDIVTTLYAVYHLIRPAKGRTPSSSASYHFFALITDAGFIPLYVFTAMMANNNHNQAPGTEHRWRSFFNNDDSTSKLFYATWLVAIACGGIHLISAVLDLYLVIIFRKIASLPPDMNPLEDNLTSRHSRKSKHKYKDSSATKSTSVTEKHLSASTMSFADSPGASHRHQAETLVPQPRAVPFFHTRTGSDPSFSPHNPKTARASLAAYSQDGGHQSYSPHSSRADLQHYHLHREGSLTPSQRHTMLNIPMPSPRQSFQRNSMAPESPRRPQMASGRNSFVSALSYAEVNLNDNKEHEPRAVSPMTQSDNWEVHPESDSDSESEQMHNSASAIRRPLDKLATSSKGLGSGDYFPVSLSGDREDRDGKDQHLNHDPSTTANNHLNPPLQPLRMHPPTPPPPPAHTHQPASRLPSQPEPYPDTVASSIYSETIPATSNPPSRAPTNRSAFSFLTSRTNEPVDGSGRYAPARTEDADADEMPMWEDEPRKMQVTNNNHDNYSYANNNTNIYPTNNLTNKINTPPKRRFYGSLRSATAAIRQTPPKGQTQPNTSSHARQSPAASPERGGTRVVSRTGIDVDVGVGPGDWSGRNGFARGRRDDDGDDGRAMREWDDGDDGATVRRGRDGGRRREVSGKVVEEGRAGAGYRGMGTVVRRVSGVAGV